MLAIANNLLTSKTKTSLFACNLVSLVTIINQYHLLPLAANLLLAVTKVIISCDQGLMYIEWKSISLDMTSMMFPLLEA